MLLHVRVPLPYLFSLPYMHYRPIFIQFLRGFCNVGTTIKHHKHCSDSVRWNRDDISPVSSIYHQYTVFTFHKKLALKLWAKVHSYRTTYSVFWKVIWSLFYLPFRILPCKLLCLDFSFRGSFLPTMFVPKHSFFCFTILFVLGLHQT
jgi:hypothetical protein